MADVVFEPDFSVFMAELDKVAKKQTVLKNLTMSFGKEGAKAYTNLENAAKKASQGQSEFVTATKANTAAMGNLRAQLIDVGVSLQGGMSPLTVLSQQGPQATEALLAMGAAAAGPVVAGLAAATVAVGPLALGLLNAYQNAQKADEASRDYYVTLGDLKRGLEGVKDELDELAVREGILSGALTLSDAEFLRAQKDAEAVFASQTDTINTQLQTLQDRLAALNSIKATSESGIGGFAKTLIGGNTAESLADETATVTKRIAELKGQLGSITTQEAEYADRLATVTTGEREAGEAAKERAKALKDGAKSAKEAQEAEYERNASIYRALKEERELREFEKKVTREGIMEQRDAVFALQEAQEEAHKALTKQLADELARRQIVKGAIIGQAQAATSAIIEMAGEESAAGKAAALAAIGLGEIKLFAESAQYGPAAPAYIALGQIPLIAALAKLAGLGAEKPDASVTDSPRPLQAGPSGATIRVAPFDKVAVARRDDELRQQVGASQGGGSTTVNLRLNGRTLQSVNAKANQGLRRNGRTQPTGQRRSKG